MKSLLIITLGITLVSCTYDDSFVRTTAYYASKISYCGLNEITDWNGEACQYFPNIQEHKGFYNESNGDQGFCAYDPDSDIIMFAFRGSSNIQNWISNVKFIKTDYNSCNGCSVHQGFLASYEDLSNSLLQCYSDLRDAHPSAKTLVTGHSLGAALTHFLVVDLYQFFGHTVDYFVNFATPRVGNKAFADYINSINTHTYRIVHDKDIVVHLPTENMGFTHTNEEVWYNEGMTSYTLCPEQEQRDCSWSIAPISASISEHTEYFGQNTGCSIGSSQNSGNVELTEENKERIKEWMNYKSEFLSI